MPEDKQFKVRVRGEKYDGHSTGDLFDKTYKSTDELKIWKEIAERHSYGLDDEEEGEPSIELTVEGLITKISELNGDGCDAIFTAEHEVDGVFVPVEDFEVLAIFDDVVEIDLDAENDEEADEDNNW